MRFCALFRDKIGDLFQHRKTFVEMQSQARTFSVIFHLRKAGSEEDKLPIYARVTIDGKRMEQSMKQRISPQDWNEKRGMAKPKSEEFKVLNRYLEQVRSALVECYSEMSMAKKIITIDSFKRAISEKMTMSSHSVSWRIATTRT